MPSVCLHGGVYLQYSPHSRDEQRGGGRTVPAAGTAVAFPGGCLCKSALRVSGGRLTGSRTPLHLQLWRVLGSVDYAAMADVLCDVSTGVAGTLVPAAFKSAVFAAIHGLAHPGIQATRRLVSSRIVWHGCASDVAG